MARSKILFYGTPEFSTYALKALLADDRFEVCAVVTQPDRPAGRSKKLLPSPVKKVALEHGLCVLQPENIRKEKESFLKALSSFLPIDMAVVSAFGQILPLEVLTFPRHDSLNIHASLLPRWRGAAPIQRAIIAGDKETGVCLMKMEAGLDTGPVYSRKTVTITEEDNAGTLHDKLAEEGAKLLIETAPDIISGTCHAEAQLSEGVVHAAKITGEDMKIDWELPARNIALQIRALAPIPGAYAQFREKRLKIFKAEVKPDFQGREKNLPGQVHMVDKGILSVSCGEDTLSLLELQPEGKKRMPVSDFIQGYQPKQEEFFK